MRLGGCDSELWALRTGFCVDEAEHFLHNRVASVATLRWCSGIVPECRSASLRNERSALPESPGRARRLFRASERSSKSPAPPTSHSASTPSTKPFTCYSSSVTTAPVRRLAPTLRSALRHETDPDCRLESRRRHEQSPGARRSLGSIERDPRFRQVEGLPFLSGTAHRGRTNRHSLPTPTDYRCQVEFGRTPRQ